MDRILIVRLGSLGDIVHTLPAVAALRDAFPRARVDWLVDAKHRAILELVPVIDRRLLLERAEGALGVGAHAQIIGELRRGKYDAVLDFQGLLKSAALGRSSGAPRVIGFAPGELREASARIFYTEMLETTGAVHVIRKNLALAGALNAKVDVVRFPIAPPASSIVPVVRQQLKMGAYDRFALMNPGAAWPNKRWPPARFGEIARHLLSYHRVPSAIVWGPGEEPLARELAATSAGAAELTPPTSLGDLVALASSATVMLSGDTGPLHIAGAVGTPLVGLFGPTNPARNGPWAAEDEVVSRFSECVCHYKRTCQIDRWCLLDISVSDVAAAVDRRLASASSISSTHA